MLFDCLDISDYIHIYYFLELIVAADRLPPISLWGGGMLRTAAQATSITLRLV